MVKPSHVHDSATHAEHTQNLKFAPVTLVQSRPVGDRIKERNAWYRRKTYEKPAGNVQTLACGCRVFVAEGSAPECPMHGATQEAA